MPIVVVLGLLMLVLVLVLVARYRASNEGMYTMEDGQMRSDDLVPDTFDEPDPMDVYSLNKRGPAFDDHDLNV